MPDIDKWSTFLQWAGGIGGFVGGAIAAIFGTRLAGKKPAAEDDRAARDDERERRELQDRVIEDRIRRDFADSIQAARKSFYDEFRRLDDGYRHEMGELEERLRQVEKDVEVLKAGRQGPAHR